MTSFVWIASNASPGAAHLYGLAFDTPLGRPVPEGADTGQWSEWDRTLLRKFNQFSLTFMVSCSQNHYTAVHAWCFPHSSSWLQVRHKECQCRALSCLDASQLSKQSKNWSNLRPSKTNGTIWKHHDSIMKQKKRMPRMPRLGLSHEGLHDADQGGLAATRSGEAFRTWIKALISLISTTSKFVFVFLLLKEKENAQIVFSLELLKYHTVSGWMKANNTLFDCLSFSINHDQ